MSYKFKDYEGREWNVHLTLGVVERVSMDMGILLTDITGANSKEGDENYLQKLALDDYLLSELIYNTVKHQHEDVSFDDWKNAMDGEAAGNAEEAFWKALTDFFRLRHRNYGVKILETRQKLMAEIEAEIDQNMEQAMKEAMDEARMNGATESQASSASTPDPSACGS